MASVTTKQEYILLSQGPLDVLKYALNSNVRTAIEKYAVVLRKKIDNEEDLRYEDLENLRMNTRDLLPEGFFSGSYSFYSAPDAVVSTEKLLEAIDAFAQLAK